MQNLQSPPSHQKSDSSAYYTALCGFSKTESYDFGTIADEKYQRRVLSPSPEDDSPLRHRAFRRQHGAAVTLALDSESALGAIESGLPGLERLDKPTDRGVLSPPRPNFRYGFTENWLKSHLATRRTPERVNWFSDEFGCSEFQPSENETLVNTNLGETHWKTEPEEPSILKHPVQIEKYQKRQGVSEQHGPKTGDSTLLSQGRLNIPHKEPEGTSAIRNMLDSRSTDSQSPTDLSEAMHTFEKQTSAPRSSRSPPEVNVSNTAANILCWPQTKQIPQLPPSVSFQRPRKRFLWRGKTCVVALPNWDEASNQKTYLKPQDVAGQLVHWEGQGYDIRGFQLSMFSDKSSSNGSEGQSRVVYPDPELAKQEWQNGIYQIGIPDKLEWEAYVNDLKEKKLRALGVSFADETPASEVPSTIPTMARQTSSQNSTLPTLPSLTSSSSTNTLPIQHANSFLHTSAGSTSNTQITHVQSPGSQYMDKPGHFHHFPRHSMALRDGEQANLSSLRLPHSNVPVPPVPGRPSPRHRGSHGSPGDVIPVLDAHVPIIDTTSLPAMISGQDLASHHILDSESAIVLAQMRQQQAQLEAQLHYQQLHQQQLLRPHWPPLAMTRDNEDDPESVQYVSQLEIATPVPRGHRQNLSETLQKEIDDAERYLDGESMRRSDLENEVSYDLVKEKAEEHTVQATAMPVTMSDIGSGPKMDILDMDTNPSIIRTPNILVGQQNPRLYSRETQSSQGSISILNVRAQEFVSELDTSPAPNIFAFSGFRASGTDILDSSESSNRTKYAGNSSAFSQSLNVDAPPFTPESLKRTATQSREFSFSTLGPSYQSENNKVNGSGKNQGTQASEIHAYNTKDKKIFGNLDLSEIIKPIKKSKAIAIVSPQERHETGKRDDEDPEDDTGRITQAKGRQKRMRRHENDGDQVPLFATPSDTMQTKSKTRILSDSIGDIDPMISNEDAKTLANATNSLKEIVDEFPTSDASSLTGDHDSAGAGGNPLEPFTFDDVEDADSQDVALRQASLSRRDTEIELSSTSLDRERRGMHLQSQSCISAISEHDFANGKPDVLQDAFSHGSRASLSATANSSEYRHVNGACASNASEASNAQAPRPLEREFTGPRYAYASYPTVVRPRSPNAILREPSKTRDLSTAEPAIHHEVRHVNGVDGVTYIEPSYTEIDAVMKHLNEEDSDLGVERVASPWQRRNFVRSPGPEYPASSRASRHLPTAQLRSDAAPPSPVSSQQPYQYLPRTDSESADTADIEMVSHKARFSPSYRPSRTDGAFESSVNRRGSHDNILISDWDDAISSANEPELHSRSGFFENRVNDLVDGIMQERLGPLEKTLANIQHSLDLLSSRSASSRGRTNHSAGIEHSDADDEDDVEDMSQSRVKSPRRDRKFENLRASLLESVNTQQSATQIQGLSEVMDAVKEMKATVSQVPQPDIKTIVEEAIGRQMRGKSAPITSSHESATAEKYQLHIAGLESMLKVADSRAGDELKARISIEHVLAETQKRLQAAKLDAAEQRESAEETERSLRAFYDERQQAMRRTAGLEDAQEDLQKRVADLSEKNAALEGTLEEYRLSSAEWREEIEEAKAENTELAKTVSLLKTEMEDSIRGRHALRTKFDRLQEDMTLAAGEIARDQSMWRNREEEHKARNSALSTKLEAETRTIERLELKIERLEMQDKEAMKGRFLVDQTQRANARLEDMVNELRLEIHEHQKAATRCEREAHDARETAKLEAHRTGKALEVNIEAANNQTTIVRTDLEGVIARLQTQLDDATIDTSAVKARYELMLEEASQSRSDALREAAEAREGALLEHYRFHERTLEESRSQHESAMASALEDRQRAESHLYDRLALSNEKIVHYQDRVGHLEEKLEIAKSAAYAAAQAAQIAKSASSRSMGRTAEPLTRSLDIPEKVSPQALRESILVLQEQLQEREIRIEMLESDLSKVDNDAPVKIRERDIEITWLRELLSVRIDDLKDIIATLSRPTYDRQAIKAAIIRLEANLQMEQQEKERAIADGRTIASIASLPLSALSPRALPLAAAAAAAWGNWRKASVTSLGTLSEALSQTPSRSSPSSQGFRSGLMTPPNTNTRQSPQPPTSKQGSRITSSSTSRPSRLYHTPRHSLSRREENSSLSNYEALATPPLMRKESYDQDAEKTCYEGEVEHSGVGNAVAPTPRDFVGDEPFGPRNQV